MLKAWRLLINQILVGIILHRGISNCTINLWVTLTLAHLPHFALLVQIGFQNPLLLRGRLIPLKLVQAQVRLEHGPHRVNVALTVQGTRPVAPWLSIEVQAGLHGEHGDLLVDVVGVATSVTVLFVVELCEDVNELLNLIHLFLHGVISTIRSRFVVAPCVALGDVGGGARWCGPLDAALGLGVRGSVLECLLELLWVVHHLGQGIDSLGDAEIGVGSQQEGYDQDNEQCRDRGVDKEAGEFLLNLLLK